MKTDRKRIPPPSETPPPDPSGGEQSQAATVPPIPGRATPPHIRQRVKLDPRTTLGRLPKPDLLREARVRDGWGSPLGGIAVRPKRDLQPSPFETTHPLRFGSQTRIETGPDGTVGKSREPASNEDSASPVKNGLHGNSWKACTLRLSPSRTSLPSGAA